MTLFAVTYESDVNCNQASGVLGIFSSIETADQAVKAQQAKLDPDSELPYVDFWIEQYELDRLELDRLELWE